MGDDTRGRKGFDPAPSGSSAGLLGVAVICIPVGFLAFGFTAASYGILSLPIVLVGLIGGWLGRSRWVRWPAFTALGSVLAWFLLLFLMSRRD